MWYNEISLYNFAKGEFSSATGHFTQLVWKSSTKLGLGLAYNGIKYYVVANYQAPGNYLGQFLTNVLPKV